MPLSTSCLWTRQSLLFGIIIGWITNCCNVTFAASSEYSSVVAEASCSDLESQYGRLMGLPVHLRPAALSSSTDENWNEEQQIWLCPDQSGPGDLRRVDFHNGLGCADVELLFSLYTSNEVANMNPQEALGFDYPSWCQCPGASTSVRDEMRNTCEMCPDGQRVRKYRLKDLFTVTRGGRTTELSCGRALEYARHITSEDRCQDALKEARSFCCQPILTTVPEESLVMTAKDIQMVLVVIGLVCVFCSLVTYILIRSMELIHMLFLYRKKR